MRFHIPLIVLAGLISDCFAAPTSIAVLQEQMANPGECVAGDCTSGYGTLRFPDGSEIMANRVNGHAVAGDAEFRYPCRPDKTFTVTLNNAERPVNGTVVRCGNLLGMLESGARTTYYTGTFQTIDNPFTQEQITTYRTGTYTDGNGVKWEGEFDYIPIRQIVDDAQWGKVAHRKGSFIFMGAKVDTQLDEVVRGLYISEPVSPGSEINFTKARPDYLVKLRSTFVADRDQDAAEREAEARASRELFNNMVTFASAAVVAYGTYKMAEAASNRAHMDSLNQVLTGKKSPAAANAELPKGKTGNSGNSAQPLTVAEYRNQQNTSSPSASYASASSTNTSSYAATQPSSHGGTGTTGGASGLGSAYASNNARVAAASGSNYTNGSSNGNTNSYSNTTSSSSMDSPAKPEKKYTWIDELMADGHNKPEAASCKDANEKIDKQNLNFNGTESKVISRGGCTCKPIYYPMPPHELASYECTVSYRVERVSIYNPNATGSSKGIAK